MAEHENDQKRERELKSAEELHRFEVNLMLGQTAVYLLASGALLNAVGAKDASTYVRVAICVFGVVLSAIFLSIAFRTTANVKGAKKRATLRR